jgi:hypothetical protein
MARTIQGGKYDRTKQQLEQTMSTLSARITPKTVNTTQATTQTLTTLLILMRSVDTCKGHSEYGDHSELLEQHSLHLLTRQNNLLWEKMN